MSPSIAYWTSAFEPDTEAIASEVATLRQRFPASVVWGVSPRRLMQLSWRRGFAFHSRLHWAFRGVAYLFQRAFDLNHLFGGLGDWFHLKALRMSPSVLTLAVHSPVSDPELLEKIQRFVVEWPSGTEELTRLGIDSSRVRLIFPPVDLQRFRPTPRPSEPFTVLFASSPDRADWLEARGVPLILDCAALRPAMRFRLVWRPWGDGLKNVRSWIEQRQLSNVELLVGRVSNMAVQYQQAHATVAPFTDRARCKPAPNSVVEGLACGRPVVTTAQVGLSELIEQGGAGKICLPEAESLAHSLDLLCGDWARYAKAARQLAERWFDVETFLRNYTQLYEELLCPRTGFCS